MTRGAAQSGRGVGERATVVDQCPDRGASPRRDLRRVMAVWAGKTVAATSRGLRRGGGTTLPGDVALAIDPEAVGKLGRRLRLGTCLVSGTNGKTTTTGLVVAALEACGLRVVTNHSGANLLDGVAAALVDDASPGGRPRADVGVFEVDELWLERAVEELAPKVVVVLNLLRDQLDRSGELETTATRIGRALRRLPPASVVVANVDDPLVAAQCEGLARLVGIGVDCDDMVLEGLPHVADARACPRCSRPLDFRRVVLAHCGTYACPGGDFSRPDPVVSVRAVEEATLEHTRLQLADGGILEAGLGGMYNAYNLLAAWAAALAMGADPAAARRGIAAFAPRFGRQEVIHLHDRRFRFLLAKNPAGFDEVLRTADELGRSTLYLLAINDGIADGRDVSWLWDVDFERLARSPNRPRAIAAGTRAEDLAVRLKYAGMPTERVRVVGHPAEALRTAAEWAEPDEEIAVVPTYTAMLALRRVAEEAGAVPAFWARPGSRGL